MQNDQLDGIDYKQSGVDIAAGEAAVKAIKDKVRSTYSPNVLSELGIFGVCIESIKLPGKTQCWYPAQMAWAPRSWWQLLLESMTLWARIW